MYTRFSINFIILIIVSVHFYVLHFFYFSSSVFLSLLDIFPAAFSKKTSLEDNSENVGKGLVSFQNFPDPTANTK